MYILKIYSLQFDMTLTFWNVEYKIDNPKKTYIIEISTLKNVNCRIQVVKMFDEASCLSPITEKCGPHFNHQKLHNFDQICLDNFHNAKLVTVILCHFHIFIRFRSDNSHDLQTSLKTWKKFRIVVYWQQLAMLSFKL